MGHREDLIAGAKACLIERGYAQTTARDIVAASDTNLASIGYHFGSKDALMTVAMMELIGEWGESFAAAAAQVGPKDSEARFRSTWRALLKLFESNGKLLLGSFEIAAQAVRSEELKAIFVAGWADARAGLPDDFIDVEGLDARAQKAVGGLLLTLISGMTLQHLIDPDGTPTPTELALGIKTIAARFSSGS